MILVQYVERRVHLSSGKYWCYLLAMSTLPQVAAQRTAPPLRYVGGDPSLDLVNTVDWTASGLQNERLPDYNRLTAWAEGAGVLSPGSGAKLRRLAAADPGAAQAALRKAWRIRGVLHRLFAGLAAGEPRADASDEFASLLRATLQELRLERQGKGTARHAWTFPASGTALDGVLAPVVWSAARLLASADAESLRMCAGPDCGWVFVDRSRNGLRRWCEMQTCGTQEKTRRRSTHILRRRQ
jgi:predicted RNA-binding Zn ribbon-like protein